MEQSPSWEADRISASQEISRILWNPTAHHRVYKSPPPLPILRQLSPVRVLPPPLPPMCTQVKRRWYMNPDTASSKTRCKRQNGLAVILFEIVKVYTSSIILAHNLTTLTMR